MTATVAVPGSRARDRGLGNGLAAASTLIWAAGFPAAEALLATWDPVAVVAGRFALAAAVMVPAWLLLEGWPRGPGLGAGLALGAVGFGGSALFILLALAVTDPVTATVIGCASPLAAALVERVLGGRRLGRGFAWGLAASVAGGVVATWGSGMGDGNLPLGVALTLLSCLCYAWLSFETVRRLPGRSALAQTGVTVGGAAGAALALAAIWAGLGRGGLPPPGAGWGDLGLLALYGVGAIGVAQLLFVAAVRRIGVGLASFHLNLAPFYVMLILLGFGGGWSWMQAVGAAVVAGGVVLAQRG